MVVLLKYLLFLQLSCCIAGLLLDIPLFLPKPVRVYTPVGEIVGNVETISFDGKFYDVKEFLGIPYAEPPVGINRLRKPVPKAPFTSTFTATSYGAICLQYNKLVSNAFNESEDCLFLNVFVPGSVDPLFSKVPVMVWIHGGGFTSGNSNYYHGDRLSAFGDVIVVTMNYRLAHLGFLKTNEGTGNFGLWDQHLAIKWVNDNIASFGGDINNITIFGESAGSSSVAYQVLFPGNKNLFQKAIAESGGITSAWAFSTDKQAAGVFANFTGEVGCQGTNEVIMACLRNKTTDEIAKTMTSTSLNYSFAVPNTDNDFVPKHPRDMLLPSSSNNKSLDVFYNIDFLMGSCRIDGALYLPYFAAALNITDLEKFKVSRPAYESYFIPSVMAAVFTNYPTILDVAKEAAIFQYTNWSDPNNDIDRNYMLVDAVTDSSMFSPMVATTQLHLRGNKNTYVYEFSIRPTTHVLPVPKWLDGPSKANHADDFLFVFGFTPKMLALFNKTGGHIDTSPEDIKNAKVVMSMWTNFAKTGYVRNFAICYKLILLISYDVASGSEITSCIFCERYVTATQQYVHNDKY